MEQSDMDLTSTSLSSQIPSSIVSNSTDDKDGLSSRLMFQEEKSFKRRKGRSSKVKKEKRNENDSLGIKKSKSKSHLKRNFKVQFTVTLPEETAVVGPKRKLKKDEDDETASKKPKPLTRCTFWPSCTRSDCPFYHPTEHCKFFPNCSFGSNCLNIHPNIPCMFGSDCKNPNCQFNHPPKSIPCKNGFACTVSGCTFSHPPIACKFGDACMNGRSCLFSHAPPCKFGIECVRPDCSFAHPPPYSVPQSKSTLPIPCKFGDSCTIPNCKFFHSNAIKTEEWNTIPEEIQEGNGDFSQMDEIVIENIEDNGNRTSH